VPTPVSAAFINEESIRQHVQFIFQPQRPRNIKVLARALVLLDLRLSIYGGMCERVLPIISPATGAKEYFSWLPCKDGEVKDENSEIVDVIGWIVGDVDELSSDRELLSLINDVDRGSFTEVSNLCSLYNRTIMQLIRQWDRCGVKPEFLRRKASREHVKFILCQCYNRAVAEPDKLNQYPPFSPQVYGETSFELISQMIDTVKITSEDHFIDLGSGVGQVVLQVAACSEAKFCYGVEKAEYPAICASRLDMEFQRWMAFYGKSYCPYLLERGDFLSSDFQERITSATVLFANNFAFGPEVDHQLKQRFANLKEGARIISSKAFCPLNFRITDRNLGDIGSIMHVSCLNPIQDAVSWTDKPFSYYVHTIDRSLLERYFSRLKNPNLKDEAEIVRRDRKGRIISDQTSKEDGVTFKAMPHKADHSRSLPTASRNRRSRSLNCVTSRKHSQSNPRNLRSNGHSLDRTVNRSVGRHKRSKYHHFSRTGKLKTVNQSVSPKTTVKSMEAKSTSSASPRKSTPLSARVRRRLAALSLASTASSKSEIQRSSSFPALTTTCSGHTTPSGSTSIASGALSNEECSTLVSAYTEIDKQKQEADLCYSPPDDAHLHHSSGYRPTATCWTSSSSSFASSISSANTRSPAQLPDEIFVHPCSDAVVTSSDLREHPALTNGIVTKVVHQDGRRPSQFTDSLKNNTSDEPESKSVNGDVTLVATSSLDIEANTSVAKRRAVRKCRQLITSTSGPSNALSTTGELTTSEQKRDRRSLRKSGSLSGTRRRNARTQLRTPTNRVEQTVLKAHLNALHDEVIAQVAGKPCEAFGKNEPVMSSFTAHYQPCELRSLKEAKDHAALTSEDVSTGCSARVVPLALTQFLELSKRVFMDHFGMLQSPAYASTVRQQLELEQARQAKLLEHTRSTEQAIAKLHADGTELLHRFTKRLGILISTPSAFFAQARKLIKHHHMLEAKISEYRKQIAELSAANQELVRRHQAEAARLLSTALHTTMPPQSLSHSRQCQSSRPTIGDSGPSDLLSESPILTTALTNIPPPPALTKACPRRQSHFGPNSNPSETRVPYKLSEDVGHTPRPDADPTNSMWSASDHPPVLIRLRERLEGSQIPPPPPLLPMHTQSSSLSVAPILVQSVPTTSVSPSRVSTCNTAASTPLKTPISSNLFSLGFHSRQSTKSMHTSLQDLIVDEFSKQSPSEIGPIGKPSILSSQSTIPCLPQFSLPPRKRAWDPIHPHQSAIPQPNAKTPRICSPSTPHRLATCTNLSPPTLSPVELRTSQNKCESEHHFLPHPKAHVQPDRDNRNTINLSTSNVPPPPLLYSSHINYSSNNYAASCENSSSPPSLPSIPVMIAQTLGP
ncbi:histone methylation protein DOT1, partial [Opisthorchis viverrini]